MPQPTDGTQHTTPPGSLTDQEGIAKLLDLTDADDESAASAAPDPALQGDDGAEGDEDSRGEDESAADRDADEDDREEQDEDEDQPDHPQTYTVKVDGKDVEVPADELVRGYLRQGDYTRKTQQLAEQRRTHEAEQTAARTAREQYGSRLDQLKRTLDALAPQEPDWDKVRAERPDEYGQLYADWQRFKERRGAVDNEIARVRTEEQAEARKGLDAHVRRERETLETVIPEFRDPVKSKELAKQLATYAAELGVTAEEFGTISDHRLIVALRKAMLYDQIQARAKDVREKGKQNAPTLKPGSRDTSPSRRTRKVREEALSRLRKSGREADGIAALMAMGDDQL